MYWKYVFCRYFFKKLEYFSYASIAVRIVEFCTPIIIFVLMIELLLTAAAEYTCSMWAEVIMISSGFYWEITALNFEVTYLHAWKTVNLVYLWLPFSPVSSGAFLNISSSIIAGWVNTGLFGYKCNGTNWDFSCLMNPNISFFLSPKFHLDAFLYPEASGEIRTYGNAVRKKGTLHTSFTISFQEIQSLISNRGTLYLIDVLVIMPLDSLE